MAENAWDRSWPKPQKFCNSCAKFNSRPWEYLFIYIHILQVISL